MRQRLALVLLAGWGWMLGAAAEPVGAVGGQSAHEAGTAEEAREEVHQPRHGGQFGDADDLYHYEVLLEAPNRLILYVNDELNRPLDVRTLQGQWTLEPDSAHPQYGIFEPSTDGTRFVATLPALSVDPVHIKVAVPKGSLLAEMEFYLRKAGSDPKANTPQ